VQAGKARFVRGHIAFPEAASEGFQKPIAFLTCKKPSRDID
jgi:hypothetical protein